MAQFLENTLQKPFSLLPSSVTLRFVYFDSYKVTYLLQ